MGNWLRGRLTFANVVSGIALFIALGAGAYAAGLAPNSVKSKHIKDDQVKTADVRDDTLSGGGLTAADLRAGSVGPDEFADLPAVRLEGPGDCAALGQAVSDSTETELAFSGEDFDVTDLHTADPNCATPTRGEIVAPRAGIYALSAGILWPGSDTDGKRALYIDAGSRYAAQSEIQAASSGATLQNVSTIERLGTGDIVRAYVSQTSGSTLLISAFDSRTFLTLNWVGPAG